MVYLSTLAGTAPFHSGIENSSGSRICQRGQTMASVRRASLNGGLGAEPPAGSRYRAPGGESGGKTPLKLKAFCTFLCKKWPKVKDLSENLPPCLSRAAMTSPKFWSMHSWIRHCTLYKTNSKLVLTCLTSFIYEYHPARTADKLSRTR